MTKEYASLVLRPDEQRHVASLAAQAGVYNLIDCDPALWRRLAAEFRLMPALQQYCLETADEFDSGFEGGEPLLA